MKSIKKLFEIIACLVIVALLVGHYSVVANSGEEWKTYESKEWGFKIDYPGSWNLHKSVSIPNIMIITFSLPEEGITKKYWGVAIEVRKVAHRFKSKEEGVEEIPIEDLTLDEWTEIVTANSKKLGVPFFKVIEESDTSLDGVLAKKQIVRMGIFKTTHIFAIKNDVGYLISYGSPNIFKPYLGMTNKMIDSFEFIW